jgi:hypothetical protein
MATPKFVIHHGGINKYTSFSDMLSQTNKVHGDVAKIYDQTFAPRPTIPQNINVVKVRNFITSPWGMASFTFLTVSLAAVLINPPILQTKKTSIATPSLNPLYVVIVSLSIAILVFFLPRIMKK